MSTIKEQIEASVNKWNDPNFTEVIVYTRPNLRNDEMSFYIGSNVYKNIFDDRKITQETGKFALMYPERFLNIIEQRMLCPLFWYYYPNATRVNVLTHSVYVIQCTKKECVKIAHFDYQDKMDMNETDNYIEDFVEGKRRFSAPPLLMQDIVSAEDYLWSNLHSLTMSARSITQKTYNQTLMEYLEVFRKLMGE